MKEIKLTQGYVAKVSDRDYAKAIKFKWWAEVKRRTDGSVWNVYAARSVRIVENVWCHQYMHRFILGLTDPRVEVDHKDHNGLNNQRRNIRTVTHAQNLRNSSKRIDNASGHQGLSWDKTRSKWVVRLQVGKCYKFKGRFDTKSEAIKILNKLQRRSK